MNPTGLPQPGLSGEILSAFDATYQWTTLAPDYSRKLIQKYGDQGLSLFMMFYNLGMKDAVQTNKGWGWEKGWIEATFNSNGTTGPYGNGAAATVVVQVSQVENGNSYPLAGDEWMHYESGVIGLITAKVGSTLTILPRMANQAFGTITAGDLWIKIDTAFAEGTEHPLGRQNYWYKYWWQTQITKHTYQITGSALTYQPQWNTLERIDGNGLVTGYDFWTEGTTDAEYRHFRDFAYMFFFGMIATNTGYPRTSTGLDYEINQRGIVYPSAGNFTRSDLVAIGDELSHVWAKNSYLVLMNRLNYQQLTATLATDFANTNLQATNQAMADLYFGGDYKKTLGLVSTFDWNTVTMDGTDYNLKINTISQDPKGWGAANGADDDDNFFTGKNYLIPLGTTAGRFGEMNKHVEFKYAAKGGYSRLFEVTENGRAARVPVGRFDLREYLLSAEAGWFFRGLEQFVVTSDSTS